MTHVRTQIRGVFVTALTGLTTTGSNVFPGRVRDLGDDQVPGLCIFTSEENIAFDDDQSRLAGEQERTCNVDVVGTVRGTGDIDALLDTIAEEVETAVFGISSSIIRRTPDLVSTYKEFDDSAEQPTGRITLMFEVFYLTADGAPGTAL